jgi:membrane protein involved in colicin uptake
LTLHTWATGPYQDRLPGGSVIVEPQVAGQADQLTITGLARAMRGRAMGRAAPCKEAILGFKQWNANRKARFQERKGKRDKQAIERQAKRDELEAKRGEARAAADAEVEAEMAADKAEAKAEMAADKKAEVKAEMAADEAEVNAEMLGTKGQDRADRAKEG